MVFCFFSAQYLPTVGGVERYTHNLAKRLILAGHRAIVVTSDMHGLPARETDEYGIEIFRLPVFPLMNGRFPVLKPSGAFFRLAKELWAENPDFCVVQTRMYTSSVYAALAARRRKISTIVIEHSTGHMPMNQPLLNFIGGIYEHLACWLIRITGARFYGVSGDVCRWLRHFRVDASGTLYNSVDPEELLAAANAEPIDWHAQLGLSPETELVAFVGRIIPEKGVAELAEAFSALHRPHTALLVAGDGPQLPELKRQNYSNVYFLGSIPYAQALQLLHQSSLYCLPTRYAEGFPTTLLEAAAMGCPILSTNTAGSAELLPDESYGLRVADNHPDTLRNALERCLNNEAWRTEAAQKTQEHLSRHFSWESTAARLLEIAQGENK